MAWRRCSYCKCSVWDYCWKHFCRVQSSFIDGFSIPLWVPVRTLCLVCAMRHYCLVFLYILMLFCIEWFLYCCWTEMMIVWVTVILRTQLHTMFIIFLTVLLFLNLATQTIMAFLSPWNGNHTEANILYTLHGPLWRYSLVDFQKACDLIDATNWSLILVPQMLIIYTCSLADKNFLKWWN